MTRRLILIRHAKAESYGDSDARRALTDRGQRDARAIGQVLSKLGVTSGVAFVSTARRAIQTWDLAADELGGQLSTTDDDRIYENTVEDLLAVIREAPTDAQVVVVVGHSPSIHALASGLDDGEGDRDVARAVASEFPTSGVAVLEVTGPWSELAAGSASLVSFAAAKG
jgi:phosphohistidine phosphatase